jgi:RNA polymerase sigma-70 factor (ECF subfamily)
MDTDEELVDRTLKGDTRAFGVLIERHQKPVVGFLLTMFHDLDLSEDAAQQAFVKAFENLRSFQGRSEFRTWVCRIALNAALSNLRWARLRRFFSGGWAEESQQSVGWEDRLARTVKSSADSDEMDRLERKLELEKAMTDLSGRERQIASLRLEGYSLSEISKILDISEGTVKSTLFSATRKMRKKLP